MGRKNVTTVEGSSTVAAVSRVRNSESDFVQSYVKNKGNVKAIAAELRITPASVTVRKSQLKKVGKVLPTYPRASGGGHSARSVEEFNAQLAALTGLPTDSDVAVAAETVTA